MPYVNWTTNAAIALMYSAAAVVGTWHYIVWNNLRLMGMTNIQIPLEQLRQHWTAVRSSIYMCQCALWWAELSEYAMCTSRYGGVAAPVSYEDNLCIVQNCYCNNGQWSMTRELCKYSIFKVECKAQPSLAAECVELLSEVLHRPSEALL